MSLARWYASRETVPKYIVYCTCSENDEDSSGLAIFDLWSFAHVFWGFIYSFPLALGVSPYICLVIVIAAAIAYELLENSVIGIWIASKLCCTPYYQGDNFWNSVADVICCLVGFGLALLVSICF